MMICGEKCETNGNSDKYQHNNQRRRKRNASEKWRRISSLPDFFFISVLCWFVDRVGVYAVVSFSRPKRMRDAYMCPAFSAHHIRTNFSDKLEKQITQANKTKLTHQLCVAHTKFFNIIVTQKKNAVVFSNATNLLRILTSTWRTIFVMKNFNHIKIFPCNVSNSEFISSWQIKIQGAVMWKSYDTNLYICTIYIYTRQFK